MVWNAVGEFEECFQPGFFGLSVSGDVNEVICSAEYGEDADEDDVGEFVEFTVGLSRVRDVSEVLEEVLGIYFDHWISVTDSFVKLESFLR